MKIILEAKREAPHDPSLLLKRRRREVKVDPKLGGQWKDPNLGGHWKVPSLVAIGRIQAWWPLEDPKLGGHWKVPSLVAIGM